MLMQLPQQRLNNQKRNFLYMCKIAILTNHDPKQLEALINSLWLNFSKTEYDGYGASWIMPNGKLATLKSSLPQARGDSLPSFVNGFYELNGELESNGGALLVHGRTATCGVNLANCHPMQSGQSALIHNGVVRSHYYKNSRATSCDSELILNAWKHGVRSGNSLENVAKNIDGYYAFSILTASKSGEILDVVRDDQASLYVGSKNNGYCFATTREAVEICGGKFLGEFTKNIHAQFINGVCVKTSGFKPYVAPARDYTFERKASKAFGGRYTPYSYERDLLSDEEQNLYSDTKLQGL